MFSSELRIFLPKPRTFILGVWMWTSAAYLHGNKKTIYAWFEEGKIHAVRTPGNIYRVCRGCLTKPVS